MNESATRVITGYLFHDAVANVEGHIVDFSDEAIRGLADSAGGGMLFLAEYSDGSREVVDVSDIKEPQPMMNGITLVQPVYVDNRMRAVCDVFDAIAAEQPAVTAMSADTAGGEKTFAQALAALKALVYGEAEHAEA